MSGLAAVLAGHEKPGIHLWHGAFDVADVRHSVEHAGWGFAYVDGWTRGETKAAFLAAVGEALDFPDYYGQNFDALADCLHDYAEEPSEDGLTRHLVWDGVAQLRRDHPESYADIRSVLDEVSADHDTFVVTVLDR